MCCMPQKEFLILETFRDLSWPDLNTDPYLVWHSCSECIFASPLRLLWPRFEQKLSLLPALGFVIRKRQNLTFDLTLTRDSRSIFKSSVYLGKTFGELSNAASRGSIQPSLGLHLWPTCFWHGRSPYICLPARTAKNCFFGTTLWLVFIFRNLILTLQDEVGGWHFIHPYLKQPVA